MVLSSLMVNRSQSFVSAVMTRWLALGWLESDLARQSPQVWCTDGAAVWRRAVVKRNLLGESRIGRSTERCSAKVNKCVKVQWSVGKVNKRPQRM